MKPIDFIKKHDPALLPLLEKALLQGRVENIMEEFAVQEALEALMDEDEMTKAEVIQLLLSENVRVTHRLFMIHEFIEPVGLMYRDENGTSVIPATFWKYRDGTQWNTGWKRFE